MQRLGRGRQGSASAPAAGPARAWRRRFGRFGTLLAGVLLLLGGLPAAAAAADSGYRFGVFPYLPPLVIDEIFGPLAARFGRDLEHPVRLKTKSSFERFADELAAESYDVILVHPFFYVDAADTHDYRPVARVDAELTAVVLVPEDRPWDGWSDLGGHILGVPPALSAVSQIVQAELRKHGLHLGRDIILRHYATKTSCLHAAALGAIEGCALPTFILARLDAMGGVGLRPLVRTAPIRHFALAVHQRVPAAHRATLLRSLLDLPGSADGEAFLAATGWPGFVAAHDREYDGVRVYRGRGRTLAQR